MSLYLFLLFSAFCNVSSLAWFGGLKSKTSNVGTLKQAILTLANETNRGLSESPQQRYGMQKLFADLEKMNKNKASLSSPLVNAVWDLKYTTSNTILGRGGSPRVGPIFQTIDAPNRFAKNSETVRYFGFLDVPRAVTAKIDPISSSKCAVQFQKFTIGPISFKCPPSFKVIPCRINHSILLCMYFCFFCILYYHFLTFHYSSSLCLFCRENLMLRMLMRI